MPDSDKPQLMAKATVDKVFTRYQQAVASIAEDMDLSEVDEDVLAGLLHGYADSALEQIAREIANDVIRSGRAEGLEDATSDIDPDELVWRRSAVLDENTCESCDALDGTEIDGPDDDLSDDCEGGKNCRCVPFAEIA